MLCEIDNNLALGMAPDCVVAARDFRFKVLELFHSLQVVKEENIPNIGPSISCLYLATGSSGQLDALVAYFAMARLSVTQKGVYSEHKCYVRTTFKDLHQMRSLKQFL